MGMDPSRDELDRLLAEAARGNRMAFGQFVRATNDQVYAFCAGIVGRAEADDAAQEAYLGLWRSLGSFRGECSARTYLFVIARRTALRLARQRERWSAAGRQAPGSLVTPPVDGAVELVDLVSALDLDRRTAIILTAVVGLSYAEAARICECPVGTIRSRVARAREQLGSALARTETG